MAIDWNRFTFLATDGDKSIWTYATPHVARDIDRMRVELPHLPRHDFISSMRGISVVFHGLPFQKIAATIDRIAGTIVEEGMNPTVAPKGEP